MKSMRLNPFHTAFIISLAFLFSYIVLASMGYMLSVEPGLTIGGISRWCERISAGIFKEPINSLSNLGFMISGLLMFSILSSDCKNKYNVNNNLHMYYGVHTINKQTFEYRQYIALILGYISYYIFIQTF